MKINNKTLRDDSDMYVHTYFNFISFCRSCDVRLICYLYYHIYARIKACVNAKRYIKC